MNQKSEKTFPRYTYLDGFGKFLMIFVKKNFFLPLLEKILDQKITFWRFLKNTVLAKNLTI